MITNGSLFCAMQLNLRKWWVCKKENLSFKRVKRERYFSSTRKSSKNKRMRFWWATKRKRKQQTKEKRKMWNMCVKRGTLNSFWHSRIIPLPFVNHFKQIFKATGRWWKWKRVNETYKLDFNYLLVFDIFCCVFYTFLTEFLASNLFQKCFKFWMKFWFNFISKYACFQL